MTPLLNLAEHADKQQIILIVVDALDEADQLEDEESILPLLARAEQLPPNVRWLLTSRQKEALRGRFATEHIEVLDLDPQSTENIEDVAQFARSRIDASQSISDIVRMHFSEVDEGISRILDASRSNFLCARLLLESIERDPQRFGRRHDLPKGLDEIYREFLRSRTAGRSIGTWRSTFRPAFGVLVASQRAVSLSEFSALTGLSLQTAHDVLIDIEEFLDPTALFEKSYRLYHQSFVDFLVDEQLAGEFWLEVASVHRAISDACQRYAGSWIAAPSYVLEFAGFHFHSAGRQTELQSFLASFDFMDAVMIRCGVAITLGYLRYVDAKDDLASTMRRCIRAQRHFFDQRPELFLQQTLSYYKDLMTVVPKDIAQSIERATEGRRRLAQGHLWFERLNHCVSRGDWALDTVLQVAARHLVLRGRELIIADSDGRIRHFDLESGLSAGYLGQGATSDLSCFAVSASGEILARCSRQNTVEIIDISKNIVRKTLHTDIDITSAEFYEELKSLAVGTRSGEFGFLNLSSGDFSVLGSLDDPIDFIRASSKQCLIAVVASAERCGYGQLYDCRRNRQIARWGNDSCGDVAFGNGFLPGVFYTDTECDPHCVTELQILDYQGGKTRSYYDHWWITALTVTPQGSIAAGRGHGSIVLWKPDPADPWDLWQCPTRIEFSGHPSHKSVCAIACSSDGKRLVSSDGTEVRIWDLTRAQMLPSYAHRQPVMTSTASPNADIAISVDRGRSLKAWDVSQLSAPFTLTRGPDQADRVFFDAEGELIVFDGKLFSRWSLGEENREKVSIKDSGAERILDISKNGSYVAMSLRGGVWAFPLRSGATKFPIISHGLDFDMSAAFSNKCELIVVSARTDFHDRDSVLFMHSFPDANQLWSIRTDYQSSIFAFGVDDHLLAYEERESVVVCDALRPSSVVCRFDTGAYVSRLAFSPDGRRLISVDVDDVIRVWNLSTAREEASYFSDARVLHLGFCQRDGSLVVIDNYMLPRIMRFAIQDF